MNRVTERPKKGEDRRTIISTSLLTDILAMMAFLCCHGSTVTDQLDCRRDAPTHTDAHTYTCVFFCLHSPTKLLILLNNINYKHFPVERKIMQIKSLLPVVIFIPDCENEYVLDSTSDSYIMMFRHKGAISKMWFFSNI